MRRNVGCNLVEWTPIDAGNCHITYSIQYENQTGIVGIINQIDDGTSAWCANSYSDAPAIKMWAVYSGNIGRKSSTIPLTENSCNSVKPPGK